MLWISRPARAHGIPLAQPSAQRPAIVGATACAQQWPSDARHTRPSRDAALNVAQRFAPSAAFCRVSMRRAASKRVGHQHASAARRFSRGNRNFMVDCGRQRQSGPRPEMGFLHQPALEGLTRSARTDSPRKIGRNNFRRMTAAAAAASFERREAAVFGSRLSDGFGSGPTGPGPTDEHSVHLHHRDFIVTPIADQIGPIDSVSKTEYYDLKNHFSEPRCKMTVLPLNSGKSRFDPCLLLGSRTPQNPLRFPGFEAGRGYDPAGGAPGGG
ncbi:hypothetical protein F511_27858 [Dorcoceras hygrometricum]|uniref:Uncharacterized protein n=1 Tax=Dorcoceras hygrometricum TaxID=472368 RepID=A0A2Z7A9I6_9LAMI|nr:hypothetical protein F511_27858 [Dorcoceras hygrometricum]